MNKQQVKKAVRTAYYVLFAVSAVTIVYFITSFVIDTWSKAWDVYISIVIAAGLFGLIQLGIWAFQDDKQYKNLSDFPRPERDSTGKFIYDTKTK